MAITKIWDIQTRLDNVIDYVVNEKKTNTQSYYNLHRVIEYTKSSYKTEKQLYVTAINCSEDNVLQEMLETKKIFEKEDKVLAYHAIQSFRENEVTPEIAHKIGIKLAEEIWGDRFQVVVTTHLNTHCLHNHFVINSVSFIDGMKYYDNPETYALIRHVSDELCREYGLTVIEKPTGKTPRSIYFAEKRGEPTKYNVIRQAIDEAMKMCINYGQFKKIMLKKGYIINDDYNRKYPTIRSINDKKAVRMYHLGEEYLPKNIANKVEHNPYYYQNRYMEFIHPKNKKQKYKVYKYKGKFKDISKMKGIDILFLLLFHLLGLLPKRENYQPLSPEMKQEVRKMERYSNEIRLIVSEKLKTTEDVKSYISRTEKDIEDVTKTKKKDRYLGR